MTGAHEAKAAKRSAAAKKTAEKRKYDVQFVKCELDKQMREELKAQPVVLEELFNGLNRMVDSGYKLSFGYEQRNDCVGVYVTAPDQDHQFHGLCLSARGTDEVGALKAILFKHYTLLEENWGSPVDRDFEPDVWG